MPTTYEPPTFHPQTFRHTTPRLKPIQSSRRSSDRGLERERLGPFSPEQDQEPRIEQRRGVLVGPRVDTMRPRFDALW